MDACGVGAVRRQVDLDHRVVELCVGREAAPTGASAGRSMMPSCSSESCSSRSEHIMPSAFDAADLADVQRHVDAGNIGAGRARRRHQARPRIWRAAYHLHRLSVAGIDMQHLQFVGVRMLLGGQHLGDHEGLQRRLVVDVFDFEADRGQPLDDLVQRRVGLEMVLQPGKRKLHVDLFRAIRYSTLQTASACRAAGSRNATASAHRRRRRRARSGMPYFSMAMRSMPMPQAKP